MTSNEQEPLLPLSASQQEALTTATESYHGSLMADETGLAAGKYLYARGIDRATAERFKLGLVYRPEPGHEPYEGMLCIPYLGHDDKPLQVRFRCFEEHNHRDYHHGKYMGIPHERGRIFNVRAVHEATEYIAVTEGEFDAIVLNMVGIPAVGIPGATNWQPHWRKVFAGFNRVYVFGDPDEAGAGMVSKVTGQLRQARAVKLEHGDVNETLMAAGADYLRSLIEKGKR